MGGGGQAPRRWSDDRALRATGYSALRGVCHEVFEDVIRLTGRVPTFHQKQVAQAAIQLTGFRMVINAIEVVNAD